MLKASVLRPGLLVSLKTSIKGGVNYQRVDVERDHETTDGARVSRWETTREIPNPQEFEAAVQARSKARSIISGACSASSFGLLCPSADEFKLMEAIKDARQVADAHNKDAQLARVEVYVLIGRVARDDEEAARAIASEVRELIEAMQAGIKEANPEAIRDAANKARNLGSMLSDDVAGKVTDAIAQARKAAREIVKRVEKAGESAAEVMKEIVTDKLESARFAFLDMDDASPVNQEAPTARPVDMPPESLDLPDFNQRNAPLPFALELE